MYRTKNKILIITSKSIDSIIIALIDEDIQLKDLLIHSKNLKSISGILKSNPVDDFLKFQYTRMLECIGDINNLVIKFIKTIDSETLILFYSTITNIISNLNTAKNIKLNLDVLDNIQDNSYLAYLQKQEFNVADIIKNSHDAFCKFMFHEIEGNYLKTPFDKIFNDTIDRVFSGEINRLIINMPVGMGKTARGLNAIISRGFAIEPKSKFIAISYDNTLIQLNSSIVKDFISSPNYKSLYNVELKSDTTAKGLWRTKQGGALRAVSSGSGITGFRAGNMNIKGFSGAMIIDDPLKPDDANSKTKMEYINNRYENTFKSRLAHENIPIIVIMQRLHKDDFTNHLIEKYGNLWHHLIIPAKIDNSIIKTDGKLIKHGISPGALWSDKYNLEVLETEKKLNPNYYYSQLQQSPLNSSNCTLISSKWINRYSRSDLQRVQFKKLYMFSDTANKTKTWNDYTVFILVAQSTDNNLYIIDMFRDKLEFQRLVPTFKEWYLLYSQLNHFNLPRLSLAYIEDKASGISLIQVLRSQGINVIALQRNRDKVYRLSNVVHLIRNGYLYIPSDKGWSSDIVREFDEFTENDSHDNDDILDCVIDAFDNMLNISSPISQHTINQIPI